VAEHGLHPNGGTCHPVVDYGVAPETELTAFVPDQLIWHESEQDDSNGLDTLVRRAPVAALTLAVPALAVPALAVPALAALTLTALTLTALTLTAPALAVLGGLPSG
jgi:hypothetical protein